MTCHSIKEFSANVISLHFTLGAKNRIMVRFSGFDSTEASKSVLKLGGGLASTNRETTHLVMPTLMRTPKLLCCLPFVKFIVSPLWIQESLQQGQFVGEQPYVLKDSELERKMNIDVSKLLSTPMRDQLFRGKIFILLLLSWILTYF